MQHDDLDRVVPLDQLDDFRVSEGDPDPRGWEVTAADGTRIGEVDELLVDTGAMKVRYLDVALDDAVLGERDRHVLIPIGCARLDAGRDRVLVDGLSAADLEGVPAYGHGPITREFERSVRGSFGPAPTPTGSGVPGDDFYADGAYDDRRFYDSRRKR